MKYIKINNFYSVFSQPDYKGLDISKFEPGSQINPSNVTYSVCATNEELSSLPTDVEEITQEQYLQEKANIQNTNQQHQADLQQLQDTVAELIKETLK
ncbi:hypothetical protein [Clostridium tyrobutyricum]|uniref:hypothetical protein n=1 Tax=Clostridium tyrobutyricum TaxID=1519 RepID=UPI001C38F8CC|nr:hypothetical protein [Clostridium tyrobutyricum]MBV4427194.1 hypothetical protein [Clostridium tyrobutyricum]MBV4442471.1 hypothetical protein [Clostridium tyrobutyricum]